MKLKLYLVENKIEFAIFAKKISVSRYYLSLIMSGAKQPSVRVCLNIERETKGVVTLMDVINMYDESKDPLKKLKLSKQAV